MELLLGDDLSSSSSVAIQLEREGITQKALHPSTIRRAAHKEARRTGMQIKCVRGRPRKALTQKTRLARLEFAQRNKSLNWSHVMFTDRKRFDFKYPGVKVSRTKWVRVGERHEATLVNHAQGVNLYAGITKYGMTACHIVTGKLAWFVANNVAY